MLRFLPPSSQIEGSVGGDPGPRPPLLTPGQLERIEEFERQFLAAWEGSGARTLRQKAQARIRELVGQHTYELEGAPRR